MSFTNFTGDVRCIYQNRILKTLNGKHQIPIRNLVCFYDTLKKKEQVTEKRSTQNNKSAIHFFKTKNGNQTYYCNY